MYSMISDNISILVLVTDYPGENRKEAHRFVHVRNMFYQSQGINVTVLNFAAGIDYSYENIHIISLKTFKKENKQYDLLISHQANIRQHYRFIKKYGNQFPHFIFVFHGHEVQRLSQVYPKPYNYVSSSKIRDVIRDIYDKFKLIVWHKYIPKIINKSTLVFVSQCMLNEFLRFTKLKLPDLRDNYKIIYNCVGKLFEEKEFNYTCRKSYDFLTIRENLDGSNYCVDIVNELAKNNPEAKFLVVGKGKFFNFNEKAKNLTWENRTLNHQEIVEILQLARCALMPTRTDTQGLMACEIATFGMPLITSDLPVCHEVFETFQNVRMIKNEEVWTKLLPICEELEKDMPYIKNKKYFSNNTCMHEVKIIKDVVELNERN